MINAIHHIAITTPDIDRLVDFYRTHFFGEIVRTFDWQQNNQTFNEGIGLQASAGRIVMVEFGNMRIEFFQFDETEERGDGTARPVSRPGFTHVAFVTDNCQAEYERLQSAGMAFQSLPVRMPAGGIFAYGRDPDGNIVEIVQLPPAN